MFWRKKNKKDPEERVGLSEHTLDRLLRMFPKRMHCPSCDDQNLNYIGRDMNADTDNIDFARYECMKCDGHYYLPEIKKYNEFREQRLRLLKRK